MLYFSVARCGVSSSVEGWLRIRNMTMALSIRQTFCSRTVPRAFTLNPKSTTTYLRSLVSIRKMNTLQEASTIYKSFKKGGPAFGGWQVRGVLSPLISWLLNFAIRCCLERTTLEQLPVQVLIGSALTASTAISMVGTLSRKVMTNYLMYTRWRDARSCYCHST